MGGGFGSKGGVGKYSIIASLFAKQLGPSGALRAHAARGEPRGGQPLRDAAEGEARRARTAGSPRVEHISWSNAGQGKWVANPDRTDEHAVRLPEPHDEVVPRRHQRGFAGGVPRTGLRRGHLRARGRRSTSSPSAWASTRSRCAAVTRRRRRTRRTTKTLFAEAAPRVLHDRRARDRLEQAPRGRHARLGAASQARHRYGVRRSGAAAVDRPRTRRSTSMPTAR